MKLTRNRLLVLLWAFALGVALSYRPPQLAPVQLGLTINVGGEFLFCRRTQAVTSTTCTLAMPFAAGKNGQVLRTNGNSLVWIDASDAEARPRKGPR